ncbi:MAG: hypothetical protein JSV88_29615 [Candidatus Aminicenantes bacterium]|nr:MAG: hypothetical protein JSV88_29615 [Candidatus Aminicenantes bacterium]
MRNTVIRGQAKICTRRREDAADACQDSFTRAFKAISRLQRQDFFYPWFYRILRNCCLNMLSRQKTANLTTNFPYDTIFFYKIYNSIL